MVQPTGTMQAVYYNGPKDFVIKQVPIPEPGDDEVLLKVTLCGLCGTDAHIHEGHFSPKWPLVPGHEAVGKVVHMGKNVIGFSEGDRCVADVGITCGNCYFCRRGETLMCENFTAKGVRLDGGFTEYITYQQSKLYKFENISDEEASLIEPASCAIHGLDKLKPPIGCEVLLIGAGPTGLILAQLLKLNGARKVTLAANAGIKMDLAKELDCADEYIRLDRDRSKAKSQWEQLKKDNPYGYDIVCECTGVESIIQDSINYVRRGGTLLVYGVYDDAARVTWPPAQIFGNELRIIGSFSQTYCFPRAVAYLDSGKIRTKGMVTDIFDLKDYQGALDKMNSRQALKIAIRPPQ